MSLSNPSIIQSILITESIPSAACSMMVSALENSPFSTFEEKEINISNSFNTWNNTCVELDLGLIKHPQHHKVFLKFHNNIVLFEGGDWTDPK